MCHEEVVSKYFSRLQKTFEDNDLLDKHHLIFNGDEKGISVNHKPPSVEADSSSYCPPAITSGKGKKSQSMVDAVLVACKSHHFLFSLKKKQHENRITCWEDYRSRWCSF
jgi:hypothetical protein